MQEREAKLLFKSNDIKLVTIIKSPNNEGWNILLETITGEQQPLVSKRSTDAREFKTSDAALRCCLRIGVDKVEVKL